MAGETDDPPVTDADPAVDQENVGDTNNAGDSNAGNSSSNHRRSSKGKKGRHACNFLGVFRSLEGIRKARRSAVSWCG